MAALPEPRLFEVVELSQLGSTDLDPLLQEEIGVWRERFAWDFRPAAEVLRRFIRLHSLLGYALRIGPDVVGYCYFVCEGRKGLIGDFYLREGYGGPEYELPLLRGVVSGLMRTPGLKRVESQLMLLRSRTAPLPFADALNRHDRYFMEAPADAARNLSPAELGTKISFVPWSDRHHEEVAHLLAAAYKGHVDSEINDQYRSIPGARHFLTNIVKYPGCGDFSPQSSVLAIDSRTGRVCGACLTSMVALNSGHVTQLCILPGMRGTHLGYELLRQGITHLDRAGATTVSLTVTATNQQAIRLYESVGFRFVSTFPALVWEGF
jgi:ribosomal protein S18 acetylase RimI-like enzyme